MTPTGKPSKLDSLERVEVRSRAEWRAWLRKHHTRKAGIWLVYWKKGHPDKHIGYVPIVEEALCFGWIDSTARTLDADRSMLHVCPRKPKSMWSKVNKGHVDRLIASKRMMPAGMKAIEVAKANGSWTTLDAVDTLEVPKDLAKALAMDRTAKKHFDAFPASARKYILYWISSARTDGTRAKRIAQTVDQAAQNIRAGMQRP
ncbi:MAG: YdeI/OmpD-associated family protein [Flavobacteriales bacterium]|nr:YdeI/OmpD-associated family protein [Flavobacteriales bacterium]MBK9628210.1 YdeI/OmpD-associated family protein [Flavobacteriales bacterium]